MIADLLAAASLLVGVTGVVYGVWYPEVKQSLSVDLDRKYGVGGDLERAKGILYHRSAPLTITVSALTTALTPPALKVVASTAGAIITGDAHYDAVLACFLIVYFTLGALSYACIRDLRQLRDVIRRLSATQSTSSVAG